MSSASSLSSSSVIREVDEVTGGGTAVEAADGETKSTKRGQGVIKTSLESHTSKPPSPKCSIQTPTNDPGFSSYEGRLAFFRTFYIPHPPAKRSYIM